MATELEAKMEKAVEATHREFARLRTGQASPAILNDVKVEYYGTPTPIPQIATVKSPEPRMLFVTPWEKQFTDPICKAILAANLGLNPSKEGDSVRVAMPILTAERRQELAKMAKKHAEEGRTAIRNLRREANDVVKKNKELPEDQSKKEMENIQKTTDKYIGIIDAALAEKEADILKV
jgi:ribosome recycling factor